MKVQKQEILKRLEQVYQGAVPALHFANPFELLVATILSAQCTDARVNQVTKYLFLKYKNARELNFDWVKDLAMQCKRYGVDFEFYDTGSNFVKDGKRYHIPHRLGKIQAQKAQKKFLL